MPAVRGVVSGVEDRMDYHRERILRHDVSLYFHDALPRPRSQTPGRLWRVRLLAYRLDRHPRSHGGAVADAHVGYPSGTAGWQGKEMSLA